MDGSRLNYDFKTTICSICTFDVEFLSGGAPAPEALAAYRETNGTHIQQSDTAVQRMRQQRELAR